MDIDVEETCLQFLALHHPVAGDLRFITVAMKITTELERIRDRVVNICEAVVNGDAPDPVSTDAQVLQISKLATGMVRDAMAAFSRSDAALVKSVWEKDKEFDDLYSHVFPNLITSLAKDPERIARDAKLALLSKDLNEISEHATNIAEMVMFMVEGKELSHMDRYERRPRTD
jgi:phosphate transport system protein